MDRVRKGHGRNSTALEKTKWWLMRWNGPRWRRCELVVAVTGTNADRLGKEAQAGEAYNQTLLLLDRQRAMTSDEVPQTRSSHGTKFCLLRKPFHAVPHPKSPRGEVHRVGCGRTKFTAKNSGWSRPRPLSPSILPPYCIRSKIRLDQNLLFTSQTWSERRANSNSSSHGA